MLVKLNKPIKITENELKSYFPNYRVVKSKYAEHGLSVDTISGTELLCFYNETNEGFTQLASDYTGKTLGVLKEYILSNKYLEFEEALKGTSLALSNTEMEESTVVFKEESVLIAEEQRKALCDFKKQTQRALEEQAQRDFEKLLGFNDKENASELSNATPLMGDDDISPKEPE